MNKIPFVLAPSQQYANKCALGDSEENHMRAIYQLVYDALVLDDRLAPYLVPDLPNTLTQSHYLAEIKRLSDAWIDSHGGKGWHLAGHSDAGGKGVDYGAIAFWYKDGNLGEQLARNVWAEVCKVTPGTDRTPYARPELYELHKVKGDAALIEYAFHDVRSGAELLHNKKAQLAEATLIGIYKTLGLTRPGTTQPKPAAGTVILGTPTATTAQAKEWARLHGATAQFIKNIDSYYSLAPICGGVNPVGAIAQSAKETNKGKYGGIVKVEQCNPAGLKITNPKGETAADHMTFNNWDMGIAAHLDHLALYAGAAGYPKTGSPDPRHFPAIKGTAATWEGLGGKYAPSLTYGQDIVAIMKEIAVTAVPKEPTPQEIAVDAALAAGIITDRAGWLDVLNGKTPVSLDNLRQAFSNAKGLRRG